MLVVSRDTVATWKSGAEILHSCMGSVECQHSYRTCLLAHCTCTSGFCDHWLSKSFLVTLWGSEASVGIKMYSVGTMLLLMAFTYSERFENLLRAVRSSDLLPGSGGARRHLPEQGRCCTPMPLQWIHLGCTLRNLLARQKGIAVLSGELVATQLQQSQKQDLPAYPTQTEFRIAFCDTSNRLVYKNSTSQFTTFQTSTETASGPP